MVLMVSVGVCAAALLLLAAANLQLLRVAAASLEAEAAPRR